MYCPFCNSADTEVYNSRPTRESTQVWRRRRCITCKKTFSTYEQINLSYLNIIKPEGRHQSYSRARLFYSISSVKLNGQPSLSQVDELVNTIEMKLIKLGRPSIYLSQFRQIISSTLAQYDFALFLAYATQQQIVRSKTELKEVLRNL